MTTAVYEACCAICGVDIRPGTPIARHTDVRLWSHQACAVRPLSDEVKARYNLIRNLDAKQQRAVAKAFGIRVTEKVGAKSNRYVMPGKVQHEIVTKALDSAKLAVALAIANGQTAPEQAVTKATPEQAAAVSPEQVRSVVKEELKQERADIISEARLQAVKGSADVVAQAVAAAREEVKRLAPRELVVQVGENGAKVNVGRAHKQFATLLKFVGAGVNVWLAGPAGSGKTTAAEQAAKALGLRFYFNGAIDTEYKLSGFVDAQGRVVSTAFREAFTNGGVYLFDEVDASLPGATLAFNAALANGACDFPGATEPVQKHPDFRVIAAGNTWGHGATMEYVGRNRLDAAFLDRFVQLTWAYDEELEASLSTNAAWCTEVQRLRRRAAEQGLKVVVSPRATIFGCKLLAAGLSTEEVREATILAKLKADDRTRLMGR
jgi:hypothetical protein